MKRRQFIQNTAAPLAMAAIAKTSQSANDTIRVGCIGTGGRCRRLMRDLSQIPDAKITAVCDVWDANLEQARDMAADGAFATKNYEEILMRKDIDAVIIATPNHWHVPITIDACKAGKDVYVEKPLTLNLEEGQSVIEAQNQTNRVVQVGMQQRSMPHLIKANKIIRSGVLGDITKVHLTWNRNSPTRSRSRYNIDPQSVDWERFLGRFEGQPFDEVRFREWRWTWDFGGGILTDLMVHYLDVAHWFLDVDHPQTASTIGDNVTTEGNWETPDSIQTLLHYPEKKLQIYFEGTFNNARNAAMMEYMGTEATLYADRGRYEIHPENEKMKYSEMVLGQGKRGADFYATPNGSLLHLQNWIDCIRSRKTPNAPVEAGVSAASGAHLGNMAYRKNAVMQWPG
ncbi:Gfo/Idh/MocA family oxidoreductase [bacterium]|nr:Gfo/Idh/MocA family oxidoreductase [bacterium]